MELHNIDVADIDKHREAVSPYIDSFVERSKGRYEREDVFVRIKQGYWILWIVHENYEVKAVLLTQFVKYPKLRELQIIMCVGEGREKWYPLIHKLEEFARFSGCQKLTAIARPGWEKIMFGYTKTHIYQEKDL